MDRFEERQEVLKLLNAADPEERLKNLEKLLSEEKQKPEVKPQFANNHIHTIYSFSPYSPTAAVYCARDEGLQTAGIMDHDTISGAEEFRRAGKIAGIGTTCGMECRASLAGTRMAGRKLNNPDQAGIAYMAIHSVPAAGFARLSEAFAPLREKRNIRNRAMVDNINALMEPYGITLDFDKDVLPISQYANGGSVTERHLLCALSEKVITKAGKENCAAFVEQKLGIALSEKQKGQLSDPQNPHFVYDLLGVMKAELVEKIYIPATDECMPFADLVKLADEVGAILCYAYLGDVTSSVTGDKKAAKFEDDFLDELFEMLREEGVHGVTYMPARNTREQMTRLQGLCRKYGMTEISGEDVNSSRQSMICPQLEDPQFRHLVDATWKLIERER
ncbi:MAG: PHP domain-containing protein [Lachnospiraceae bacterium]|nr:PHP domain-containing protein [Lachnospiraceae bacterium]